MCFKLIIIGYVFRNGVLGTRSSSFPKSNRYQGQLPGEISIEMEEEFGNEEIPELFKLPSLGTSDVACEDLSDCLFFSF